MWYEIAIETILFAVGNIFSGHFVSRITWEKK